MKINLDQSLYTLKGQTLKVNDEQGKQKDATLKDFLENVALADTDNDSKQKYPDFKLALKLEKSEGQIELTSKECTRLQTKSEQLHNNLVYGQLKDILDGNENPLNPDNSVDNGDEVSEE